MREVSVKTLKKWILLGLVLAGVGLVIAQMEMDPGVALQTAATTRGPIRSYVEDRAKTTLPHVLEVTMPLAGRILPIDKEAGTLVTQGEIIARVDPADLDTEVAVAQADLERIEGEIRVNQNQGIETTAMTEAKDWVGALTTTALAADEVIKANQASKDFTDWWLKAVKALKTEGAIADEKLRRAQMDEAKANVDLATSILTSQVVWAVKDIFELGPKFVTEYLSLKALRTDILEKGQVAAAARLQKARRDRARCDISAPIDGIILARHAQDERVLPAGAKLLDLGDLSQLEITADVLTQDATRIKSGDAVEIFGEAIGAKPLMGILDRVKPQGFTKISSLGVEQQRVEAVIRLNPGELERLKSTGRNLGLDYRVQVRIFTAQAKDALIVPRMALFQGVDDKWQVFAVQNGHTRVTAVEVGLMNENEAQVLSGLEENERVVVAPPKDLANGAKVLASR